MINNLEDVALAISLKNNLIYWHPFLRNATKLDIKHKFVVLVLTHDLNENRPSEMIEAPSKVIDHKEIMIICERKFVAVDKIKYRKRWNNCFWLRSVKRFKINHFKWLTNCLEKLTVATPSKSWAGQF